MKPLSMNCNFCLFVFFSLVLFLLSFVQRILSGAGLYGFEVCSVAKLHKVFDFAMPSFSLNKMLVRMVFVQDSSCILSIYIHLISNTVKCSTIATHSTLNSLMLIIFMTMQLLDFCLFVCYG